MLKTNGPFPPDPPERSTEFDHFRPQTRLNFEHLLPANATEAGIKALTAAGVNGGAGGAGSAGSAGSSGTTNAGGLPINPDGTPNYAAYYSSGGAGGWDDDELIDTAHVLFFFAVLFTVCMTVR